MSIPPSARVAGGVQPPASEALVLQYCNASNCEARTVHQTASSPLGMALHTPVQDTSQSKLTHIVLRVPTTQLAKMSVDLKFVKLTADVLEN